MTDPKFEKELEAAMEQTPMPRVAQLTTHNTLDTAKLMDVARARQDFALGELSRLSMEYQLERTRVLEDTRMEIEKLERTARQRLSRLETDYVAKMKPAKDMADLVGKMIDGRA